jgi:hypothetical protein
MEVAIGGVDTVHASGCEEGEVPLRLVRLDVEPAEIHLTAMRRKWASCSTRGRVTFDVGLLVQPESFRREVVVHELLHLRSQTTDLCSAPCCRPHSLARRGELCGSAGDRRGPPAFVRN